MSVAAIDPLDEPGALRGAALWYARHGVKVFPLRPGSKRPATAHGFKDATTDLDQVRAWWDEMPDANIGLATGHGFDVVDVDSAEGHDRVDELVDADDLDTVLGTVSTPRGTHLYIPATGMRNLAGMLEKVDFRGEGGYVVAPPSRVGGGVYRWVEPPAFDAEGGNRGFVARFGPKPRQVHEASTPGGPVTTLPAGQVGTAYGVAALNAEAVDVANAAEGTRNATLNRAAFSLAQLVKGGELHAETVARTLRQAARDAGLGDAEITATLRSAGNAAQARTAPPVEPVPEPFVLEPGEVVEAGADGGAVARQWPAEDLDAQDVARFWDTPELEHVRQAAWASDLRAEALLAAVLVRVAGEIHPKVTLPALRGTHGSLNFFAAICGATGMGKSQCAGAADRLLPHARATRFTPSSGEGIIATFRDRFPVEEEDAGGKKHTRHVEGWVTRAAVGVIDEVGIMSANASRNGSTLEARLRTLWMGATDGTANAGRENRRTLPGHGYRLGLLVGAQPGHADVLLGDAAATAGTSGRFLLAPARVATFYDDVPWPGPLEVRWAVPRVDPGRDVLARFEGGIPEAGMVVLDVPEAVRLEVRTAQRAAAAGSGDPTAGHRAFLRLRLAAIFAVLHGRAGVEPDDWWRAGFLLDVSDEVLAWMRAEASRQDEERAADQGRKDAARDDARKHEAVRRAAAAFTRAVSRHEKGAAHDPPGCTFACISRAGPSYRDHRADGIEYAVAVGWLAVAERERSPQDRSTTERTVVTYLPGPRAKEAS